MESQYNGVLIIDKPQNMTSRDVVNKISKILATKKTGHTGTLDPLATGVLVLTIGKYTKLSNFLMSNYKTYDVSMELGYLTDTLDITGQIIKRSNLEISEDEIKNTINSFIGSYDQEVPLYSAVKINGKRLYEYARGNIDVNLPKREVHIMSIDNVSIFRSAVNFTCIVSKGTYIRSLVRDIGNKLGCYATMSKLKRTAQGQFKIEESYSIEDIENNNYKLLTVKDLLKNIYTIDCDDILYKKISNGVLQNINMDEDYIAYRYKNEYVALYKKCKDNTHRMYVKF